MQKNKATDILVQIVELLTPLDSEERHRIIKASMTLLGETPIKVDEKLNDENGVGGNIDGIPPRALSWIKQNGLTLEEIQQVFHISDENVDVIASVPGKNQKAQTLNAYVLIGIANMLKTGTPNFDDKSARALCKASGCLNDANHSVYMRDVGNKISGSKEKGWTLTVPGQKHGASLVKELNKPEQ